MDDAFSAPKQTGGFFCLIFQSFSKETTGKVLALLKWFVVFAGLAFLLLEDELNKASAQRFDLPSERFWC